MKSRKAFWMVLLAFALGCGARTNLDVPSSDAALDSFDTSNAAPVDGHVDACSFNAPFVSGDTWTGTYTCPQGLTNLALQIVSGKSANIVAIFAFTFGSIKGSFYLQGTYDPAVTTATFMAGAWIVQPAGWETVSMNGTVDVCATPMLYAGKITSPGCGSFTLTM